MPAYFESGFLVRQPAWHKLGTVLENSPSIEEGIKLAGLDWTVELKDLVTVDKAQAILTNNITQQNALAEITPNVQHKAVVRSTDGSILGVVGPRYTPLQNLQAFNWFSDYIDSGLCSLETAGSLKKGKAVWILASIQRPNEMVVEGDEIKKYFLISNSHDGSQAVRIGSTNIRVVCQNTLSAALHSRQSSLIRIRHSASVKHNLDSMKQIIDEVDMSFKATAEQYRFLAGRQINSADLRKYVKILLKVDNLPDEEISTRTSNMLDLIIGNMDNPAQQIPGITGTYYSAYQSFNEYLCHTSGRNDDNRLYNIWFGNNVVKNNAALDLAINMAS